jgi:hypothetical protein
LRKWMQQESKNEVRDRSVRRQLHLWKNASFGRLFRKIKSAEDHKEVRSMTGL